MKSNIYFEPPSRLQLLDKLKHLVRFSDFLLVVSGERGAGKSTLLDQLQPEKNDPTLCCCLVKPESELSQQKLLGTLIEQLPSHEASGTGFADQLKVFHLQLQAMSAAGQKCLILIDDAEYLADDAFRLLINLHAAGARLVFLSEPSYAASLLSTDVVKNMEGRVHQVVIEGMTSDETSEYLQICHPALSSLPEKKKIDLITLSEGMPGRIETLLAGGKIATPTPVKKTAFPLPPIHMTGIGIVLMGIVGVSLWQFMPEEPAIDQSIAVEERVSVPLEVPAASGQVDEIVVEGSVKEAPVLPAEESLIPAREELASRLKAQENKLRPKSEAVVQATSNQVKTEELPPAAEQQVSTFPTKPKEKPDTTSKLEKDLREIVQASAESKPSVTKTIEKAEVAKKVVKHAQHLSKSEFALMEWPSKGYTLQMLGARSESSARGFIREQSKPGDFYHFSTIYKGLPWHVVVYGQYTNRDVANAAIKKLPKELQIVKPWARSIQGVKIDIKSKK